MTKERKIGDNIKLRRLVSSIKEILKDSKLNDKLKLNLIYGELCKL